MAARADRAARPLLTVVSHNVRGLGSDPAKYIQLLRAWRAQGAHVVCVQETWSGRSPGCTEEAARMGFSQAAGSLGLPPPQVWFASNVSEPGSRAGVAVVLLCPSVVCDVQVDEVRPSRDGRVISCRLRWAGHAITLINTYWPLLRAAQRIFSEDPHGSLRTAISGARRDSMLLVGDFNHVVDAMLDRTRLPESGAAHNGDRRAEQGVAAQCATMLAASGHECADVYRRLHPTQSGYTHVTAGSAARLDRAYLASKLLPYVHACGVRGAPGCSDHLPLQLSILPRDLPPIRGATGMWRADTAFLADPALLKQLQDWARTAAEWGMLLPDQQLLDWWPHLKAMYQQVVRKLSRQFAAPSELSATESAAAAQLQQALAGLDAAAPVAQPAQLAEVAHAQSTLSRLTRERAQYAAQQQRAAWLTAREAPCPALSRLLRHPPSGPRLAALSTPAGGLVTEPREVASMVARHFAGVSRQQAVGAAEQASVLAAVEEQQRQQPQLRRRMTEAAARSAGDPVITSEEVAAAMQLLAPGKSPGPDGLPVELWWLGGNGVWVPMLSRLFTVMRAQFSMPADFALGAVCPIYKGSGPLSTAASFRPITLLNADYKVLTKVLAGRFGEAMSDSIGVDQGAFLPGRDIGDSIAFEQLLSAALSAAGLPGAAVLLDIAKAYDTIDRQFLLAAMRAHGACADMVAWVSLLLSDTRAVATVSRHVSEPQVWEAGVRQGCPLSPVLYLFVAEALACWLCACPALGVVAASGRRHVSSHFADDTKVFLPSLDAGLVAELLQHLEVFGRASGQRINAVKSSAIPLGTLTVEEAGELGAIPVRGSAVSLGVVTERLSVQHIERAGREGLRGVREPPPAAPAGPPSLQWERRIAAVEAMCGMVSGQHLSAMGRGMAVSAYALSPVLFHAEHEGLPPGVEQRLQRAAARAVDLPRRLPGVPSQLLAGSPAVGGFGLLPIGVHVAARHIKRASSLLAALSGVPPPLPPLPPLPEAEELPGGVGGDLPQPEPQPQPQPLWVELAAQVLRAVCPGFHPVQTLMLATFSTREDAQRGRLTGVTEQRMLMPRGPLLRATVALQRMGQLQFPAAAGEDTAAPGDLRAWLMTPGMPEEEVSRLAARVVWPGVPPLAPCSGLSVREATTHLMAAPAAQRVASQHAYARQALASAQPQLPQQECDRRISSFINGIRTIWRLPWENGFKEVLWRLAVNGVSGAGGHGVCHRTSCVCGHMVSARDRQLWGSAAHRQHAFWDCPVARSVVAQLQQGLGGRQLQQWQVWLAQRPAGSAVRQVVWRVVALAALYAMQQGRRQMWWQHHNSGESAGAVVQAACGHAVCVFWLALHDFARGTRPAPSSGWEAVGPDHPFLSVRVQVPGVPKVAVMVSPLS